jgi:hypothetical protein
MKIYSLRSHVYFITGTNRQDRCAAIGNKGPHLVKGLFIQSANCERDHCDFPRDFTREPSTSFKLQIDGGRIHVCVRGRALYKQALV